MTQEKIDSIRERMCDEYCKWPGMPVQRVLYDIFYYGNGKHNLFRVSNSGKGSYNFGLWNPYE